MLIQYAYDCTFSASMRHSIPGAAEGGAVPGEVLRSRTGVLGESMIWSHLVLHAFSGPFFLSSSILEDFRTVSLRIFLPPVVGAGKLDALAARGGGNYSNPYGSYVHS